MIDYKLHIPGPVNVSDATYNAMCTPVMGHRSPDFVELYQSCQPNLQKLFQTKDPVFLSTSSAWGVMEGALRNLCRKKFFAACAERFLTSGWMLQEELVCKQTRYRLNGDKILIRTN